MKIIFIYFNLCHKHKHFLTFWPGPLPFLAILWALPGKSKSGRSSYRKTFFLFLRSYILHLMYTCSQLKTNKQRQNTHFRPQQPQNQNPLCSLNPHHIHWWTDWCVRASADKGWQHWNERSSCELSSLLFSQRLRLSGFRFDRGWMWEKVCRIRQPHEQTVVCCRRDDTDLWKPDGSTVGRCQQSSRKNRAVNFEPLVPFFKTFLLVMFLLKSFPALLKANMIELHWMCLTLASIKAVLWWNVAVLQEKSEWMTSKLPITEGSHNGRPRWWPVAT